MSTPETKTIDSLQKFVAELDELRRKYQIPAVTGIILYSNQLAPFDSKDKVLSVVDAQYCRTFSTAINMAAQSISGQHKPHIVI